MAKLQFTSVASTLWKTEYQTEFVWKTPWKDKLVDPSDHIAEATQTDTFYPEMTDAVTSPESDTQKRKSSVSLGKEKKPPFENYGMERKDKKMSRNNFKTFNVHAPESELVPFTKERPRRMQVYEAEHLLKRGRKPGEERHYRKAMDILRHLDAQGDKAHYCTEYQDEFRDWFKNQQKPSSKSSSHSFQTQNIDTFTKETQHQPGDIAKHNQKWHPVKKVDVGEIGGRKKSYHTTSENQKQETQLMRILKYSIPPPGPIVISRKGY